MINYLTELPFAWLGLALLGALVAALAALYFWKSRKKISKTKPSPGFTCPCYAPPYIHTEKKQ